MHMYPRRRLPKIRAALGRINQPARPTHPERTRRESRGRTSSDRPDLWVCRSARMDALRRLFTCCSASSCPSDAPEPSPVPKSTTREKESLLEMYGIVDDEDDGELLGADGPMSPGQVQSLIDRQIALTQEADEESDSEQTLRVGRRRPG